MPQGTTWESQGQVQAESEQQNLGHFPLLGFAGGMLWGCWGKPGLVNSKQKVHVGFSSTGVLI